MSFFFNSKFEVQTLNLPLAEINDKFTSEQFPRSHVTFNSSTVGTGNTDRENHVWHLKPRYGHLNR